MDRIIAQISEAIKGTEFENKCYLVGGFVRDMIMGSESSDLDIVVAMDKGGIRLAEFLFEKGISSRPVIFKNFGTAFVIMGDHKVEFVMTRQESYRAGSRKPSVKAGTLKEDVFRRDFTINSILLSLSTFKLMDMTGRGLEDIEKRIIRATSDPQLLSQEDPLRMLRAIRFAVQLDFIIEEDTYGWIEKSSAAIRNISIERIRDELQRILLSDAPVRGINLLLNSGLLKLIIPELIPALNQKQNKYHIDTVFGHTMEVISNTEADINLRLAALLHDIAKPFCLTSDETGVHFYGHENESAVMAGKILSRLKFPLKIQKLVKELIRSHMKLKQAGENGEKISNQKIRRLILDWGDDLDLLLKLVHADNLAHAPEYVLKQQIPGLRKRIKQLKKELTNAEMPVKGKDVIELFKLEPGLQVGKYLKESKEIWLKHPDWDKDMILRYLKNKEGKNGRGK